MARRATVRWNVVKQRWMAWVTFPDGSRRKVGRVERADAGTDLSSLLAQRATAEAAAARRERLASFDDVIDTWIAAGAAAADWQAEPPRQEESPRTPSPSRLTPGRHCG